MLKDVTLGQFFPGSSLLHRLDPRMKLILTILYIAAVFLADNLLSFGLLVIFTLSLVFMSKIPLKIIMRGMKTLIVILIFTAVINIFWTSGEHLLVSFWIINIYLEGVLFALMMVLRVTMLLVGTGVILTYTTSPIALTDGLERLLSPLKCIKLPVHEFAMMMTIALRFVPTLVEETDKIMSAQKARGADFDSGNLLARAKALIPVLIPLFVSAFRRADDLAVAMECRCYRGGDGRTRMTVTHLSAADYLVLAVFIAVCAAVVFVNIISAPFAL